MNCAIYPDSKISGVATVPTVYGIETEIQMPHSRIFVLLQQYLPFTVLKLNKHFVLPANSVASCNSTYRLRY